MSEFWCPGCHHLHLSLRHSPLNFGWNCAGPKYFWPTGLPLPDQCGSPSHTREEVVYGTFSYHSPGRNPPIRLHFYWNVQLCIRQFYSILLNFLKGTVMLFFLFFLFLSNFRYFIFTSFWAYKIYYVYGFMLLVVLILIVVTVCVTIVCTYFLLNAEDYRWYSKI